GPIILGIGVLVSGAALVVWIVPMVRRTPAPASETRSDRNPESTTAPSAAGVDDKMAAFFAAVPPRAAAAPPALEPLAGTWTATIVSVDVEGDLAPIRDPRGLPPFKFVIQSASGGWQMAAADGRGTP